MVIQLANGLADELNEETMNASVTPMSSDDGFIIVETNYRIYAYTGEILERN